jgi:hypothetical protein
VSKSITNATRVIQCLVALGRIDNYLSEDDVPEYVSTLRRPVPSPLTSVDTRLGCSNAIFRWPSGLPPIQSTQESENKPGVLTRLGSVWSSTLSLPARLLGLRRGNTEEILVDEEPVAEGGEQETVFELKDIGIVFPEGMISLVCGPTGCGKSACK